MPINGPESRNGFANSARILPKDEIPCVWMLAGVLTYWICDRELRCENCPLDAALRHTAGRIRCLPTARSQHGHRPRPPVAPPGTRQPEGSGARHSLTLEEAMKLVLPQFDSQALYSRAHTWVRLETEQQARIGLDPFAARIVGRSRSLVLASTGAKILQGHPCAWLDQDGGTLTVLSPLTGTIVARNERLTTESNLMLEDPQGEDWLLLIRPSHPQSEARALQTAAEFDAIVVQDRQRWQGEVSAALEGSAASLGVTLQDGGQPLYDFKDVLGSKRHHRIVAPFLGRTGP